MAYENPQAGSLKRKRRRRADKPAISARLYLDSNLKGEVGVLSEDLLQDLYPSREGATGGEVYAALAPWTPDPTPSGSEWTVLPFRRTTKDERPLPASTIRFPASALGTQSFVNVVQTLFPNRTIRQNVAVEVRISDVVPLTLDSVFVAVDTDALQKLENVQRKYAGGFGQTNGIAGRKAGKRASPAPPSPHEEEPPATTEDRRKQLVHDALAAVQVAHTGDLLALPLTHPVTHASAPPARILGCEPVSQGLLSPATKIVLVPIAEKRPVPFSGRAMISPRLPEEDGEDDDVSEQFYSATEENSPAKPVVISKSATDMSNSEDLFDSSAEDSNLSDDDDDMISLAKPGLSDQPSGLASALMSMTPRPFGLMTGISTPGSVYSHVTTTTIRGGQPVRSRAFNTQGLLEKIPDGLLHPRPPPDEDEEARVYVDSTTLAKLGCFSGDWAKIEPTESHFLPQLSAFGGFEGSLSQPWRPVKVYSLPESMSKKPQRYQVNPRGGRRDSISSFATAAGAVPTIYLSPILLANLNGSENVTLSPLPMNKRQNLKRPATPRPTSVSSRMPPTASEVTLRKVVTPLSTERALDNALFASLKQYFERKQRILKAGDLIAVPIDESLGRSMYEGEAEKEGSSQNEMLSRWNTGDAQDSVRGSTSVAWFSIEDVTAQQDESEMVDGADGWGGVAAIDPMKMTMRQSGDDHRKLPATSNNTWPYYMHVVNHSSRPSTNVSGAPGLPEQPSPYTSNLQRRVRELFSVSTSPRAVHLGLPPLALLLTSTQRSIGKATTVRTTCAELGMHYFAIDAYDIVSESGSGFDTGAQGLFEARCDRALECGAEFTALCVQHLETLNSDRVAASLKNVLEGCRVLVATTTDVDKLPDSVRGLFTHEIEMTAPDEAEREGILKNVVNSIGMPVASDVDLAAVAVKTAALVAGDLVDVVDRAVVARNARIEQLAASTSRTSGQVITTKDITLSGGAAATSLIAADFDEAVDFARKNFADSIGAPKIPNVQWSDVGGLTNVKDAVIETIQLPLSRPELFAKGLKKRSGILFYGPPGTGKTLLAKAIATEFSLNFFSVKGPELLNMYIGESEANVRRVFQRARDARPCVVFFDELDSVAPKRGNQGDSGGVMDRIVSQLLAELDGMSDGEDTGGGVFVIGATNRPDLLDQALLRPGRFDKMLYLGISDTHEKQATILQALTRKFTLSPSLSLPNVASALPFTFTGADLYALCSDAMLKAITRSARAVDSRVAAINKERSKRGQGAITVAGFFDHHASDADTSIEVVEEDFAEARRELVPSVSLEELGHYERVRNSFEGVKDRDGKADGGEANGRPALPNGGSRPESARQVNGGGPGEEDDFVVRTDKLAIDGPGRPVSSKGKGKGKVREVRQEAVNADGDGEDLYD
ncbi:peroxisomal assembly protein [Saxophila tyrrhenica]|uniref:Peroxisomal ATPase PEX6 n=1 Tax=Saxophila tyrrhenica TaxID=1690608 RepID=A0AAV9PKI0_9PEZI|nr:peroxisomal assembly protein [Saxophila tyrrhenica]